MSMVAVSTRTLRVRRSSKLAVRLARYGPSALAAVVALALIIRMAFDEGGYFSPAYTGAGVIAFATLGVLLLIRLPHFALSSRGLLGLSALGGLTAWTALSNAWSLAPDTALDYAQRDLCYLGLFALALYAAGSGRHVRQIVWGALATITAIVGAGLLSRLFPDLVHSTPPNIGGERVYRLSYPLGYWNAYGALAAMGCVLGVGLAADIRSSVGPRVLSAGAAVLMGTATFMSLSRGADVALLVGLVVLGALAVRPGTLLLTVAAVGGGVGLAVVRLEVHRVLLDRPTTSAAQQHAGKTFALELAIIAVAVMAIVAAIAIGRAARSLQRLGRRSVPWLRRTATALAAATVVAAIVFASAIGHAAGSAGDFVARQAHDFWTPTSVAVPSGEARLTSARTSRSDIYRIAFQGFTDDPLRGDGAGGFAVRYLQARKSDEFVRNAHSLELETLGELGIVGLGLLGLFIGSIVVGAVRSRLRPEAGLARSQSAAVSAACTVWLIHSGFDWDWQMTALTGIVLVLASTLYPEGRRRRTGETPEPTPR